jgi:hypothetical protein
VVGAHLREPDVPAREVLAAVPVAAAMPVVPVAPVPVAPVAAPAEASAPDLVAVAVSPAVVPEVRADPVVAPAVLPAAVARAWDVAVPISVGPVVGVGTSKSWSRPS